MKPQIPWLRVFVEGVVIVGSILLAFGIDAAWEGRQERAEEQEMLEGLSREFSAYQRRLENDAARSRRSMRLMAPVMAAGPPDFRDPPAPLAADSALYWMSFVATFDTEGGTLAAILNSGRLELIQNEGLRELLAAWPRRASDIRDNELWSRDFHTMVFVPFLVANGALLSRAHALRSDEWPTGLMSDAEAALAYSDLFRDPRFQVVATDKYGQLQNGTPEYEEAAARASEILAVIESELAR